MKAKLHYLARGRADAWQAARRYLTPREADALAADLNIDRHDRMFAERRALDCAEPSPDLTRSDPS